MDVKLPDGTVVKNVPDGMSKEQFVGLAVANGYGRSLASPEDRAMADPTRGMSQFERFNAGIGKAFSDVGRGASQLVGLGPTAQETRETRSQDSPLMRTGAGIGGNIMGNLALFAPTALIPGAGTVAGAGAIGSTIAALQPAEGVGERALNMGLGGALGAGTQLVASHPAEVLNAVKQIGTAPFRAAGAAVEPFSQAGRDRVLGRTVADAIGPTNRSAVESRLSNAGTLVPGSLPTAGEAGQSGGLAALQRAAAAVDPESYATRALQQNEARTAALSDLAGTQGARDFAAANRDATAQMLYKQANDLGVDVSKMTAARRGEVTKLLQTPAIQKALQDARGLAANEMVSMKNPAGSVKGLDYVKRALDDQIGAAQGNEQRVLVGLKDRLLKTIDTLSPEYAAARSVYADMSKPVNQMDIAQRISDKATNPLTGALRPDAFARALSDDTAAAATGLRSATLEGILEPQQLAMLNSIRDDLGRGVMARDLGRGAGSDTVQKLAMTNLMQRAGLPQGVLNAPILGRVGDWAYRVADEQMRQQLARTLLNPQDTARLLSLAPPPAAGLPMLSQAQRDALSLLPRAGAMSGVPYISQ